MRLSDALSGGDGLNMAFVFVICQRPCPRGEAFSNVSLGLHPPNKKEGPARVSTRESSKGDATFAAISPNRGRWDGV